MVHSHLRVFFSQEQETPFFWQMWIHFKTLTQVPLTLCVWVLCRKNTRSTRSWFPRWLRDKYCQCEQAIRVSWLWGEVASSLTWRLTPSRALKLMRYHLQQTEKQQCSQIHTCRSAWIFAEWRQRTTENNVAQTPVGSCARCEFISNTPTVK